MDISLNLTLFIISMLLSSLGSFLDVYTTYIGIRDLGVEYEANERARNTLQKHGFKRELLYDAILIIIIGIIDSLNPRVDSINLRLLYSPFIFLGLLFLIVRGLAATYNLQKIIEYRTIGIDAFKEKSELRKRAFQNISFMNKIKSILPYFVEALICFFIYVMLFTVDFPLVILSRYLVFGLFVSSIARMLFR
jgi:hypothetical protein